MSFLKNKGDRRFCRLKISDGGRAETGELESERRDEQVARALNANAPWAGARRWTAARQIISLLVLSITLAAASPHADAQAGTDPAATEKEQLIELEESLKFNEALRLIDRSAQKPSYAKHQDKVKAFAKEFPLIDLGVRQQRFKEAEEILKKNSDKADAVEDPGLVAAALTKTAEVDCAIKKAVEAQAKAVMARAHQMENQGKYAEASKLYEEALAVDASKLEAPLSPAFRSEAQVQKFHAEEEKTKSEVAFWAQFWKSLSAGLTTLGTWVVCLAAALLLFWLAAALKRLLPPEKGARIVMEDLTGTAGDREAKSQGLTREIAMRLTAIGSPTGQSTELDDTPDLDSANLPNIVIHHDSQAAQLPLANTAASVGPFSINPAQLFALMQQLAARPCEHSFKGSLVPQGSKQVVVLECVSINAALDKKRWQSSADGTDSAKVREEVLTKIAEWVAFELLQPRSTNSFASFYAYRSGKALMNSARTAEDRVDILAKASQLFRDCIQADPGNWMGWFYLATVLRKCGQNEQATNHFRFLQELVEQPSSLLKTFIDSHPDFPVIVDYNYAVCLSKLDNWDEHWKSVELLEKLIAN